MAEADQQVRLEKKVVRRRRAAAQALRVVAVAAVLAVGLAVVWRWKGADAYDRWNLKRWLARAHAALDANDLKGASTAARHAYITRPTSLEAARIMASIADRTASPSALQWRRHIVDLEPWNPTNRLLLAQTALRNRDWLGAAQALSEYPLNPPPPAYYHDTAGAISLALGDVGDARAHFLEAVRLEPKDDNRQINLAGAELRSSAEAYREDARQRLRALVDKSSVRIEALRLLTEDALSRQSPKEAASFAVQLRDTTNAPLSALLVGLAALQVAQDPGYGMEHDRISRMALGSPQDLGAFIGWMNVHNEAPAALAWAAKLEPERLKSPAVVAARAETLVTLRDWLGLRALCRSEDWGSADSIRLAYATIAERRLAGDAGAPAGADALWKRAIAAAQQNTGTLEWLAQIADQWGMPKEAESAYWEAALSSYSPEDSLMILYGRYVSAQDARGQLRVARRKLELHPRDKAALNNFVYLSMLLGSTDPDLDGRIAALRAQAGKDPVLISTCAFAQFRHGDESGAVNLLSQIPAEARKAAPMAVVRAAIMAAAGDRNEARIAIEAADPSRLMPEEAKLLDEARRRVFGNP